MHFKYKDLTPKEIDSPSEIFDSSTRGRVDISEAADSHDGAVEPFLSFAVFYSFGQGPSAFTYSVKGLPLYYREVDMSLAVPTYCIFVVRIVI